MKTISLLAAGVALAISGMSPAVAQKQAKASKGQRMQTAAMQDVPRCTRKLGTLSIIDGDDPSGWTQHQLAPPAKLLKVLVQRSGCFNLVDRGAGLSAATLERNIGGDLGLQRGSNVGQGQIKAADYVLVAEVQGANDRTSGNAIGAGLGGLVGGRFGGVLGGISSRKLEANTVLSITNVRTTETVAVEEGYAAKNDISFAAGGGVGFLGGALGAVGGGYENTDIGRIVALSFIQAYGKLVTGLGGLDANAAAAAPTKTFTAQGPVTLRKAAAATGAAIRELPAGAIVYPTGNKNGLWWEVADENDNVGWVLNTKLAPSR
jgi:curli biogenesis system outer membrane secretion channel CsgG